MASVFSLPEAPPWAVPVSAPFLLLLLGGLGPRDAWKLSRGAAVSPFEQSNILHRVKIARWKLWVMRDFLKSLITLPVALWGVR